jgi:hypothetical protein
MSSLNLMKIYHQVMKQRMWKLAFVLEDPEKMTNKKFREVLVRDLIAQVHEANITVGGVSRGRPSSSGAHRSRLEVKHSRHWPSKGKQRRCRVCSLDKKTRSTLYSCKKCDVGLCVVGCFEKWHTCIRV